MGYRALLFCPDEKTARTVTQVLSELDFSVEPCSEPFAAVKKLMGEHFDAVVVDCENEQNATLLFKSSRSSTSNQASLAVAVVEGQAGVAKAFRIGANLVLTKPINVEQAKGTLRVARGLLRKGDPAKASAPGATTPVAPKSAAPLPPAAKPVATVSTSGTSGARPAAVAPIVNPVVPTLNRPAQAARAAVASSARADHDQDLLEIDVDADTDSSASASPVQAAFKSAPQPPAPRALTTHVPQSAAPSSSVAGFGGGAASAPAPARVAQKPEVQETVAPSAPVELPEVHLGSDENSAAPASTFTFGGANLPTTSSSGKKVGIGIALAALVLIGLYVAWTQFHDKLGSPENAPQQTAPVPIQPAQVKPAQTAPAVKPSSISPTPAASSAGTSSSPSGSAITVEPIPDSSPAEHASGDSATTDDDQPVAERHANKATARGSATPSNSASSSTAKGASPAKHESQPIVVKNSSSAPRPKPAAVETAAPSMVGIAAAGSGGALSNLIPNQGNAPRPVLQTLNVSQGVSQGLVIKKVQPSYPPSALRMHVEGAVELSATIGKSGNIVAVKIIKGEPLLAKAAVDAVKQWKYKPYFLNGEPVEIQTQITVNFKLPH
jgi:TonB family protein